MARLFAFQRNLEELLFTTVRGPVGPMRQIIPAHLLPSRTGQENQKIVFRTASSHHTYTQIIER